MLSAPITIYITIKLMFYSFFSFLARYKYLFILSLFLFSLWKRQNPLDDWFSRFFFFFFFFFVNYHKVWSSLYLKIQKNFPSFIFLDRFWFVHILSSSMVKIQSLAQFPMNPLSHPVVPCLVLFWGLFGIFTYNVINRFIFLLSWMFTSILFYVWFFN